MSENVIINEQCGSMGDVILYAKAANEIIEIKSTGKLTKTFQVITHFFCEILLPYGYPDSVSEDYFQYQLWDTLQAFCSTITAAFTTRAILKGVGVGDAEASALSATVTWIMKDGTGMLGRILFAWWKGNGLDPDCKKWRLFADILNDGAMMIELFLPYFTQLSMQLLCLTTGMKSIVGIAGGATRASITHHQAIKDNMAEISAKDGSQETLVNLVASFVSIFLLNVFHDSLSTWIFVVVLMAIHLTANYLAVSALIFRNFNDQRLAMVLKSYFNIGMVLNPVRVNAKESVFLGYGLKVSDLCGFEIKLATPLGRHIKSYNAANLKHTLSFYVDKKYFILPDLEKRIMYVSFEKDVCPEEVLAGYIHATCLAIAVCIVNGFDLDIFSKRQLHHSTPITRLHSFMKKFEENNVTAGQLVLPHNVLAHFAEYVDQEMAMFFTAIRINGWKMDSHSLKMGEWRTQWKKYNEKIL